ncbi:MAG: DEAD/DEAH box helicase [Candidatus Marinarcus sp.]|uniref:DEAD/DEAH box helicase n=1 Tax=Candidatus Marinarcus sp. TaxID=3100987 RepID=UPI003B00D5B7
MKNKVKTPVSFTAFNFSLEIERALKHNGYMTPTAIQSQVIPLVLARKDVIAKAQTGSGKTASFVLPILHHIMNNQKSKKKRIQALVLTPTRELTLQVAEVFSLLGKYCSEKPKIVSVIGGEQIGDQLHEIQKGCDVLVATAGRFIDVLKKKQMNLEFLEFLVLDEADKMLDLGFAQELDLILEALPPKRQNLFFSATYPPKILNLVAKITTDALNVDIEEETLVVQKIHQRVIEVNKENRAPLLRHLLKSELWDHVLVFMANKRSADNIAAKFRKHGFKADSFHGDLIQEERNFTLNEFKEKKLNILFATDIAARGLDICDIACVVNFDLPRSPADYVHRVGRTARAGKSGVALTFIDHEDQEHFKLIEKRCQITLEKEQIEGFELKGEPVLKAKGNEPIKGKRKSKKDKLREQAQQNTK